LQRVTRRRIAHIAAAFRELGLKGTAADNQAMLAYSAYLGFLQLQRQGQAPDVDSHTFEDYVEHVIDQLID
ncbi:MAG: TetR/AcrR family transcriptional regulator, partial [Xanthomonadales bacterium]|nr:TetR/AcrR family transcriptional regulator [Xanthomonadales bacterium]